MANQTISVHRRRYAVGLFWQPVAPGVTGRAAARHLAKSIDGHYNLYVEYKQMVGVSMRRTGQKSGMPSAAAEVCEALAEHSSFLAVFAVENGFYMVVVRNGIILTDKVFEDESDARAEYARLAQMPDWGAFIAPSKWGMPRAVEHDLNDVITGRSHAMLRSISMTRSIVWSILLVVLFILIFALIYREPVIKSFSYHPSMKNINPEQAEEYQRLVDEKNKELDEQFQIEKKVVEVKPIVPPYNTLPNVAARADMCYRAIGFLMQPISGWNQVSAKCDENYATVNVRRTYGTIGDFYAIATELMPGAFVQELSEDTLTIRAKLPKLNTFSSRDERAPDDIVRDVMTAFQSIDTPVDVQTVVDTVSNGVETQNFDVVEVAASSKLTPMQFMHIFDNFGGVYMTNCNWNASNRTWNYEVIIYAK